MLILDNLEEKDFCSFRPHGPFNLCHMRKVVATVAKFHAVSLTYKQMLFSTFSAQKAQATASREDVARNEQAHDASFIRCVPPMPE